MGNVLFQIAAAIAYAIKNDIVFSVQTATDNPFWNPLYLQHLANTDWIEGKEDVIIKEEKEFVYNKIEFSEEWREKQIVLDGYWQNEKYFNHIRNEILYLFNFPWELKNGVVSIHVRRGDYLVLTDKHPPVTKEWFEKAMSIFTNKEFKFFSDDIKWCKETFGGRDNISFSTNTSETEDLIEMSCCESHICSASTFSWWGMWLNKNPDKRAIFPELWFQLGHGGFDTSDIIPSWCEKLSL
jgi:hypothetical protein